ncbi:DUF4133 domain-containing protein [Spirosoma endbachense]|uniref:DUF4133 domain-containing protein n=1 Tax=Spirosoma endbachense TaxID=2666025 RepID=A0A6P1VT53_9BACT|nr:DUF4133 domain-containing protein [Spirosoma endbachense]QHV95598.1 DUF4133 domain-containing protein [Spirosoma endbachense]
MAYEINKGADRPPQVRGVVGMDYLALLVKWIIGIVVTGGVSAVFVPLPGWVIFSACGMGSYAVYMGLVKRSANQGAGGYERTKARKKLPGIVTVRQDSVYRNLRKK